MLILIQLKSNEEASEEPIILLHHWRKHYDIPFKFKTIMHWFYKNNDFGKQEISRTISNTFKGRCRYK